FAASSRRMQLAAHAARHDVHHRVAAMSARAPPYEGFLRTERAAILPPCGGSRRGRSRTGRRFPHSSSPPLVAPNDSVFRIESPVPIGLPRPERQTIGNAPTRAEDGVERSARVGRPRRIRLGGDGGACRPCETRPERRSVKRSGVLGCSKSRLRWTLGLAARRRGAARAPGGALPPARCAVFRSLARTRRRRGRR